MSSRDKNLPYEILTLSHFGFKYCSVHLLLLSIAFNNYPELDDTDVEHVETENHRFQELEVNVELAEDLVVETEGVNLNVKSSISLHCFA